MKMTVLSPGPLSTVQDNGRLGYMSVGFSQGGAMDAEAMQIANILVGNARDEGVIEMTFMGLSAEFDTDCVIALTGADMCPKINGSPVDSYRAVQVKVGDVLTVGLANTGMRGYLAVAGGFDIAPVMGSVSTNLKCALGGFLGRKLQAGDEIPLRRGTRLLSGDKRIAEHTAVVSDEVTVRVILGPQDGMFTAKGIKAFLSEAYTVSEKSDRMGVRLDGAVIENKDGVDIISDGIAAGSVQIPASGTPIIMMADRQTTGGYAKIATVISADLPIVAQARPGTRIRFASVTQKKAVALIKAREKIFDALESKIALK